MECESTFKNLIKDLPVSDLLNVATIGICRQVNYCEIDNKILYCFKQNVSYGDITYIITDNPKELLKYIINYILSKDANITNSMLCFDIYNPIIEQYDSDIILDEQPFICFPARSEDWCNRKIYNKQSLIEYISDKLDGKRLNELNEAVTKNATFVIHGEEINDYVMYVFDIYYESGDWVPMQVYDL